MKTLKRLLASLMVAVMILTAAPLSGFVGLKLDLDWLDLDWIDFSSVVGASDTATVSINLVSEDESSVTVSVVLDEGENVGVLEVAVTAKTASIGALTEIQFNKDAFDICAPNMESGRIAVACADSFGAGTLIAEYTFLKTVSESVCAEDFEITVYNCADIDLNTVECVAVNNIPEVVYTLGDINIDDRINSIDALMVMQIATGRVIPNSRKIKAGDVNKNNKITTMDAWFILCHAVGMIIGFEGAENYVCTEESPILTFETSVVDNKLVLSADIVSGNAHALDIDFVTEGLTCSSISTKKEVFNMSTSNEEDVEGCFNASFAVIEGAGVVDDFLTSEFEIVNTEYYSLSVVAYDCDKEITNEFLIGNRFIYELNENNEAVITGYFGTNDSSVSIPSEIDGYVVTGIGENAFSGCDYITEVTIPDSITDIGDNAFEGCSEIGITYFAGASALWDLISIGAGNSYLTKNVVCLVDIDKPYVDMGKCGNNLNWILYKDGELVVSGSGPMWNYGDYIEEPYPEKPTEPSTEETTRQTTTHRQTTTNWWDTEIPVDPEVPEPPSAWTEKTTTGWSEDMPIVSTTDWTTSWGLERAVESTTEPTTEVSSEPSTEQTTERPTEVTVESTTQRTTEATTEKTTESTTESTTERTTLPEGYPVSDYAPWYKHNSLISSVTIGDSVTSIGNNAFYNCYNIKEVNIGNSVTEIGQQAFSCCENLTDIVLPDSVRTIRMSAFYGCGSLERLDIPDSVSSIGSFAFYNCYVLSDVVIGDGVTYVGEYTFAECYNLTKVTIGDNVANIGYSAFYNCWSMTELTMPISAKIYNSWETFGDCYNIQKITLTKGNGTAQNYSIGSYYNSPTYYGYTPWYISGCTDITIEDGVTAIGDYTFNNNNLSEITLPESVKTVGAYAFAYCYNLANVTIGNGVTSIGDGAFYGCYGIVELTMPISAKIYDSWETFGECYNIQKITLTKGNGKSQNYSTSSYEYNGIAYYGYTPWYISGCTYIIIEDGVTAIGDYTFYNNNLSEITLPESIETIGDYTFYNCNYLVGITIPDGVTAIGRYAFYDCNRLEYAHIGDGVTDIGEYAFYNCDNLSDITIGNSIENIGRYAFYYCSAINSLELSESLRTIGNYAFAYCTGLTRIDIAEGVEIIGEYAFCGCLNLENITLPSTLESIGRFAFAYSTFTEFTIPENTAEIGKAVLYDNHNLVSLSVPFIGGNQNSSYYLEFFFNNYWYKENTSVPSTLKSVEVTNATSIVYNAFRECSYIENITLNKGITSIGSYAFYHCSSLKGIVIPDTVTNISDYAFSGCSSMTTVDLGNGRNLQLNYGVFNNCSSVESYSIGKLNNNYCTDKYGVLYTSDMSGLIYYPSGNSRTEYTVNHNAVYISEHAFENSFNLESITLPDGLMSIGNYAFRRCVELQEIVIPEGTYNVSFAAFEDCVSLLEITIPASLSYIGEYAFNGCVYVEKINYNASYLNQDSECISIFNNCGTRSDGIDVVFGDTVVNIPNNLFDYSYYYYDSYSSGYCYHCGNTYDDYDRNNIQPYITSVTIGKNVESIGYDVLYGLQDLTSVYYNATDCYGEYDLINYCPKLTEVVIGKDVRKIPSNFIMDCDALAEIRIPASVTEIGDFAFAYNDALETVRFESSDEIAIGSDIFQASYKVTVYCKENSFMHSYAMMNGIKFALVDGADNPNFEIKNDVLISYKGSENNVFVNSASRIGFGAFKGNESLKSVELSSGVDRIFGSAFADCTNLEKVIIPKNVSSIADGAFNGCDNLTIWCYAGSYAESYAIINDIPVEYIALEIDKSFVALRFKETARLSADFNTALQDNVNVWWTSSNPDVVSVSSDGVITALSIGEATITATASTGVSASCKVTVTNEGGQVHGVALGFNITLNKREEITVNPNIDADEGALYTVSYSSSDKSVVTVDQNGKITAVSAGTATITCTVTDGQGNRFEATITVVVNNSADNFELSEDEIYVTINSTKQLTGIISPSTVENKEIIWESTNPSVATVDVTGNVKGVMAGTAVIVATTRDGGLKDYCIVKVVGVEALSSATIDHEKGIITGLSSNMGSLDDFIEISDPSCSLTYSMIGTNSIVYIERGEEIVDAYTIVIYGDVNGDGWYDGQDAVLVSCLANGMLTKEDVGEAVYMAADCNHDGVIDRFDVDLLNQAGTLLASVDQSKPAEVLLETSSAYVEYLDLIDQSPGIEIEDETDTEIDTDIEIEDSPEADVDTTPEQDENKAEVSIFEMIFNFIKSIFAMLISYISVPI